MKKYILRFIPEPMLLAYRTFCKNQYQKRRRAQRGRATIFSQQAFAELIKTLGIVEGDCVMVHSALGQFNTVEGGVQGVLDTILRVIGERGTLIVPTFPHWSTTLAMNAPFDVRSTPSDTGFFCELVRKNPRAMRSIHPTHSVAAIGNLAQQITEGHEHSPYAFDMSSPFFKHVKAGGKILLIGISIDYMTSFHIYEDLLAGTTWLPVYEETPRVFDITGYDGKTSRYTGFFHSVIMAGQRNLGRLREAFEKSAQLKAIQTDFSQISSINAKMMVHTCLEQLRLGQSAYGEVATTQELIEKIDNALMELHQGNIPASS